VTLPRPTRSTIVLAGLVLAAVVSTRWVRLNMSQSAPGGFYWLAAVHPPLTRETLVVLPVPASVQPWLSRWTPLLKPVAAVPGDTVCIADHHLFLNGWWYGQVLEEAHGKVLPHVPEGCQTVPEGHVFLATPFSRSLDGRYFGMTPVADVTAQAVPLLIWR
jgi:conjugative transfer signal peptidase TraF